MWLPVADDFGLMIGNWMIAKREKVQAMESARGRLNANFDKRSICRMREY